MAYLGQKIDYLRLLKMRKESAFLSDLSWLLERYDIEELVGIDSRVLAKELVTLLKEKAKVRASKQ